MASSFRPARASFGLVISATLALVAAAPSSTRAAANAGDPAAANVGDPAGAGTAAMMPPSATPEAVPDLSLGPLTSLGTNTAASFTGLNLALQLGAVAATAALSQTDADYEVHAFFADNPRAYAISAPAAYVGYAVPVLLCGAMYGLGLGRDDAETLAAAHAVTQAVALTFVYHSLLKAVTGRVPPTGDEATMREDSHTFRFGFMRGGIHWGWPSGHMAVNTAALVSLSAFYPDNRVITVAKYLYLSYMFYGVISHEGGRMHWLSDAVAGTLIGSAIGNTVGQSFRDAVDAGATTNASGRAPAPSGLLTGGSGLGSVQIMPGIIEGRPGLLVSGAL